VVSPWTSINVYYDTDFVSGAGFRVEIIPMLANDTAIRAVVLKSDVPGFTMAHFDVWVSSIRQGIKIS
jgi:hypothetical protein